MALNRLYTIMYAHQVTWFVLAHSNLNRTNKIIEMSFSDQLTSPNLILNLMVFVSRAKCLRFVSQS